MQTKQNLGIERGQCSFYRNVRVKENVLMHISEFVNLIRNGKWKNEVSSYRQLMRDGKTEEAGRIKSNLPAILVAGECEGGHTKANFRKFSGELILDVDGCAEKTRELLHQLKVQPWVRAGWVSVSDNGFKVVVRVDAESPHEFEKQAYPQVAARVQEIIGFLVDKQCKDLTRMCYASWDEDAFWKEDCEVFPWRENVSELPVPEEPVSSKNPASIEKISTSTVSKAAVSEAHGFIAHFFERFRRTHTFVPGSRHDFLLKLGASARRNGMNLEELDQLIALAEPFCFAPDYAPGEIKRNITDSYYFTEEKMAAEDEGFRARDQGGPSTPFREYRPDGMEEDADPEAEEEEKKERDRKLRLDAPYLPDWIFDSLPELLKRGVKVAKNGRQRDMILLSMLTNLSACMPNVKMRYDDEWIYPHLFLAVIASAASGKGVMKNAAKLGWLIQKEIDKENVRKRKEHDNAVLAWEKERNLAVKGKREVELESCPEPELRETLFVPGTISRSQLILLMAGSPNGVLLNVSELDTLRAAVNAEYGRFDDLMRACFHHEAFGSDFKTDKRAYMVHSPKMAFCGSGTPSQFYRLCPSIENGAYSRYLIYLGEQDAEFQLMAPRGEKEDKDKVFRELGEDTYRMYRYLKAYPTEVSFTDNQWNFHHSFFQSLLQGVKMEEVEGPVSVVFRHGMMAARLAMILTALRKAEAEWSFLDMTCTDEDFMLALAIVEVLATHSLLFATSLHKIKSAPTEMRPYFRVRHALERLKSSFTYTDLVSALKLEGFGMTTAKRYRVRLMELGIIAKQEENYCFAHRNWRSKLEKTPLGKV